jgi:hypothetical protein
MALANARLKSEIVQKKGQNGIGTWEQVTRVVIVQPDGTEIEVPQEIILAAGFIHDAKVGHGVVHLTLVGDADVEALGIQAYLVEPDEDDEDEDDDE